MTDVGTELNLMTIAMRQSKLLGQRRMIILTGACILKLVKMMIIGIAGICITYISAMQ